MTSAVSRHDQRRDAPSGADAELERLFAEHADRILVSCVRRLPSRPEAEDAVQLTFLHALRALRRGVVPEHESAWLHAIATNVCREHARTASRRPHGDGVLVESLAATEPNHDERELVAGVLDALDAIPERQRRALVLREWRGLTALEIADHLDLSAPATHALLTRARQSLVRAVIASRRAAPGVASLGHELRHWVKALAGATSVKAGAVASVVVVGGVGGAGIALEREADAGRAVSPVLEGRPASGGSVEGTPDLGGGVVVPASAAEQRERPGNVRSLVGEKGLAGTLARITGLDGGGPITGPWTPPPEPRPGPGPDADPAPVPGDAPEPGVPGEPGADPKGAVGDLPTPPEAEPPPVDLPPVDPPPVDLPPVDLPPIEAPEVDLPGDALPPVELPPVDLPPVDLPPVDLPPLDLPPLRDLLGPG